MRLFFAFALDEATRTAAARIEDDLQRRLASAGGARAVKWVERENLHVTLRFLGEVDDARSSALIDALDAPLSVPPFSILVGGAGAFPTSGPPRVLWLGIREGGKQATSVFDALESRLAPMGFEAEERAYTPHLTLGRVREIDRTHGRMLRESLDAVPQTIGTVHVGAVTLYQSRLSPKGPRYEVVTEIPLS